MRNELHAVPLTQEFLEVSSGVLKSIAMFGDNVLCALISPSRAYGSSLGSLSRETGAEPRPLAPAHVRTAAGPTRSSESEGAAFRIDPAPARATNGPPAIIEIMVSD